MFGVAVTSFAFDTCGKISLMEAIL